MVTKRLACCLPLEPFLRLELADAGNVRDCAAADWRAGPAASSALEPAPGAMPAVKPADETIDDAGVNKSPDGVALLPIGERLHAGEANDNSPRKGGRFRSEVAWPSTWSVSNAKRRTACRIGKRPGLPPARVTDSTSVDVSAKTGASIWVEAIKPDVLLMFSGGLDSTGVFWQLAKQGRKIHLHHMNLNNVENRGMAESQAVGKILSYMKHVASFTFSESAHVYPSFNISLFGTATSLRSWLATFVWRRRGSRKLRSE